MNERLQFNGPEPVRVALEKGLIVVKPKTILSDLSAAEVASLSQRDDWQVLDALPLPTAASPKAVWVEYATYSGLDGCDNMTKDEIIEALRER